MEIQRNNIPVRVQHIENRRIVDLICGHLRFQEWEHDHLHACEVCQGVLYVLVSQQTRPRTGRDKKGAGEAA